MLTQLTSSCRVASVFAASVLLISSLDSGALTFTSVQTFSASPNAPLAGLLELTTDDYSRVVLSISDGDRTWEQDFYDYAETHALPLLGFKPGTTNRISIVAYDVAGTGQWGQSPSNLSRSRYQAIFQRLPCCQASQR